MRNSPKSRSVDRNLEQGSASPAYSQNRADPAGFDAIREDGQAEPRPLQLKYENAFMGYW